MSKDLRTLDAGCGYGRIADFVEDYTGVDFSPDLIAEARRLHPDKMFLLWDLKALPFYRHQFDLAFAIGIRDMILTHVDEATWLTILGELKRVAKRVLVADCSGKKFEEV